MKCLRRFFRKPPTPRVRHQTPKTNVVSIVVGHNSEKQGAVNYLGESEFVFNKRIAKKLKLKLSQRWIPSVIFTRGAGSYNEQCDRIYDACLEHKVRLSVHLHFNSASGDVLGCEALIVESETPLDNLFAGIFTGTLAKRYGFKNRGVKTLKRGHNGYGMMKAVRDSGAIAVLVEPCFADKKTSESELIFEQEDKYVDVLADAIQKAVE